MRDSSWLLALSVCCLTLISTRPPKPYASSMLSAQASLFESKLDRRVERFDTSGRTLIASVLDLAYEYELPIGLEYIDHDAATHPINLEFRDEPVRGILVALVQQVPEYKVSFSEGLVDVYSPKARDDSSNLLNKIIKSFGVSELDTRRAEMELFCALTHELTPSGGCGGSIEEGQWEPIRVTVHLQNAKVYEILNAITSQNGKAVWTVVVPPNKLSEVPFGGLWHIYPLEPAYKAGVLDKVSSVAPR